jgi:hypothetical protein
MDRFDEYRRNAAECQRMAESTRNETDQRSWLRLAESWLRLLSGEPRGASSKSASPKNASPKSASSGERARRDFDAEHHARGTRQRASESAH